jgi:hypothetical protein
LQMDMEPAKVLIVLQHEEFEHRLKIFRGTPQAELLSSIREVLGLAPSQSIQFFDEDDDRVLLSSWAPTGTRVKVSLTSGGNGSLRETVPARLPVIEPTAQSTQGISGDGGARKGDGVQANEEIPKKVKRAIELLGVADLAIGAPVSEPLAGVWGALQEGAGLNETVEAYKVVYDMSRDRETSPDLRPLAAAIRDILVLRCVQGVGLMDSNRFIMEIADGFGEEHSENLDLWSSLGFRIKGSCVRFLIGPICA